ncbi:hypothetical protein Vadar_030579 [Vaccinium darrowii]|uniref:Uncharacterized protein n=1 Tax=Vaccinium darrowii TaxID=229202 RepID=A0ACB7XDE8_9ERIC|nr:hypothetical protein Vadar_030579 [Vaccinium darrowii]
MIGALSATGRMAMARGTMKNFRKEHIAPQASTVDRTNYFPEGVNLWKLMGDFNLHGITAPVEYGGLGLGYLYHCIAMEELSCASGSVALSYDVHSNVCINQLVRNASPCSEGEVLAKVNLISGEHGGALSMSEPNAGSVVVSMKCKADRVDGGYILKGNKMWCTNGPVAQTLVVYAKTDVTAGSKGITAFIVEKGMPGFSTAQKLHKIGMQGSDTCGLIFENCFVPEENALGQEGKGVYVLMSRLDLERLVLAAGPLGLMQACLDFFPIYGNENSLDAQLVNSSLCRGKLRTCILHCSLPGKKVLWSYVYSVARDCDNGRVNPKDCAGAILCAAERATQVALQAIQCLGGNGFINEYPTSEISRLVIGRELFKEQ